ncbi:OmpA family protein [Olleya namhaensis]|uniref:OmpA family protein n=1 Tax=Olleya namhaensis TaxID=1144750 RepID=UPI00233046E3|nr:OmpA family protein [Olleya namhaensis]
MKNIVTIILIFVSISGFAQSKYNKADRLFDKMWYVEAASEYEKLINDGDRSIHVLQKAGDAYYFNTNMESAYKWYEILISEYLNEIDPEYIFRFAHTLEGKGEHKLAKKWMKTFAKRSKQKDSRTQQYAQNDITIEDILNIEPQFTLRNLSINTENSDFGPMYYGERLVYSSAIDTSYFHKRTYSWNEQPFLNFQLGRINATAADVEYLNAFSKELETKYHEATLAFSPDEKKVYFTRNNFNGKLGRDGEGINHLKLYSADLNISLNETVQWHNVKELPFNSDDYSVGHPTISEDGKLLYFVSDMPGSIGATDIYVVDIIADSTYSQPRNLGPKINTAGREMFPFITNKKLYFASDGHLGLGGLDVFEVNNDNVFENPINLGAPLNSTLDDFAYIVKEDTNLGFVCSNRAGGKGDDDIYSFDRNPSETREQVSSECSGWVTGYVSNEVTGERIANATVKIFNESGKELMQAQTNLNGNYAFKSDLDCITRYDVKVSKVGYNPNEKPFITSKDGEETIVPLGLKIINKGFYEDRGLVKIKIGIIYFDLDKSFIRNDATIELNKVVLMMNQYPNMLINIESHTDSRSPDNYNIELSDRRAKEARDYIISQGINADRILSAIGYGETQTVNNCKNGIPCTEAQHQLNRRSEFIIVRM